MLGRIWSTLTVLLMITISVGIIIFSGALTLDSPSRTLEINDSTYAEISSNGDNYWVENIDSTQNKRVIQNKYFQISETKLDSANMMFLQSALEYKPRVVVLALGTNDARALDTGARESFVAADLQYQNAAFDRLTNATKIVFDLLKDVECLVVVGVQEDTSVLGLDRWGRVINDALHQGLKASAGDSKKRHWLDWAATMAQHPEYRANDGLRLNTAGIEAYNKAVAEAIRVACK